MTDDLTEYVISNSGTVHAGTPGQGAECGSTHSGEWDMLEAPDLETAVMKYNHSPCSFCFEEHNHLIGWRQFVYTDLFEHDLAPDPPDDVPDRWLNQGDSDE